MLNFFSFFTIESNLFASAILLVAIRSRSPRVGSLRGAATLYMATTGIVFVLLLSGLQEELQTTIPWVNAVVHYIVPVLLVLDWLVDPAPLPTSYGATLARWLAFPLAYAAYSLIRGSLTGWYPYPFLNPTSGGIISVLLNAVAIAVGVATIGFFIIWYARLRLNKHSSGSSMLCNF